MLPQRSLFASKHLSSQLRSPFLRQAIQRRFASTEGSALKGAQDNAFNRERQAIKDHASATSDLWRKLSIYTVIPALIIASVNAKVLWDAHWDHWDHMEPLEERTEYSYQNIRTRNYFWGDGDKTLFWNKNTNYHKPAE